MNESLWMLGKQRPDVFSNDNTLKDIHAKGQSLCKTSVCA